MTEVHGISTPATGLETLEARIPRRGGEAPAYLGEARRRRQLSDHSDRAGDFRPQRSYSRHRASLRGLGLSRHRAGFLRRSRRSLDAAPDINAIRAIVAKTPDAATMEDFDAALAFAAARGGDSARAAITGFCWAGASPGFTRRITQVFARRFPGIDRLDGEHTPNHPRWPVDIAGELKVPTLGLYGGADPVDPAQPSRRNARAAAGERRPGGNPCL